MSFRSFASDNNSGVHPEVLRFLSEANKDHAIAYGDDPWTARFERAIRGLFGPKARVYSVFNGTGANVTAIASVLKPFEAVITTEASHLHVDECGALERVTGLKLLTVPHENGKLRPEQLARFRHWEGSEHHVQPRLVSITQSTEWGTVYTLDELKALGREAKRLGYLLHIDGARFSNAAVALGVSYRDIVRAAQADLLSLGGTKNGLLAAEAVVVLNPKLARHFKFTRKSQMQLASKMRFFSGPFAQYLESRLWEKNAKHANLRARELAAVLKKYPELSLLSEPTVNAVFVRIPNAALKRLQKQFFFYVWEPGPVASVARLMTSFDTTSEDLKALDRALEALFHGKSKPRRA